MRLHSDTTDQLRGLEEKAGGDFVQSVKVLLELLEKNSPLADINKILQKGKIKLPKLKTSRASRQWTPIRNVIRIIANILNITEHKIISLELKSMKCGCDYFKGDLSYTTEAGVYDGEYKWQWTKFEDYKRNFDKFTDFPKIAVLIQNPK